MPRRTRRRTWKKKRLTGNSSFSNRAPVATKMLTRMKYHDAISVNPGIGNVGAHVFSANGLYDPDITGVGHQPRGLDQILALYDHFVALGSKIHLKIDNSDNASSIVVGIAVLDTATASASVDYYMESGYVKSVICPGGNEGARTLSLKVNPNKFLGRSHPMSDSQLKGSSSANPTEGVYFHVFAFAPDTAIDAGDVNLSVDIEYAVAFIEPKIPPVS